MDFLNPGDLVRGDYDGDVARRCEPAAAATGKADHLDAHRNEFVDGSLNRRAPAARRGTAAPRLDVRRGHRDAPHPDIGINAVGLVGEADVGRQQDDAIGGRCDRTCPVLF